VKMGHPMTTRPLDKVYVGISISETEPAELRAHGLTPADITTVTVELCRRFVSLGARVVLGHQWRPGGIMESVARFAQVYQPESTEPIILNFLAYPDRAALSEADRTQLHALVWIDDDDRNRRHLPKREALREMRQKMAERTTARVCLCGKLKQPDGFVPGLIEEAALTLERQQPVYVSKMMGGSAALLARFFQGERYALSALETTVDFAHYIKTLSAFTPPRLADMCGLTPSELDELFDAQNLDTVVHLTTKGLYERSRRG
jgi:hypothetical protein